MLEIKVSDADLNITVEGNAKEVLADVVYTFHIATKHVASLAAKDENAVSKIEREILATVVASYITEETGRSIGTADGEKFASVLTKILREEIKTNILANMLDEPEQKQPDGDPDGEE